MFSDAKYALSLQLNQELHWFMQGWDELNHCYKTGIDTI